MVRLALAFFSELAAFTVLAVWGGQVGGWPLAVLLPVLAIVLWGLFAAPRARYRVPAAARAVEIAVLGGAVLAFVDLGRPWGALAFAVTVFLGVTAAHSPAARPAGADPTRTSPSPGPG